MQRLAVTVALIVAAFAWVSVAGASTIRLDWTERLDKGPQTRLVFHVGALETTGKTWAATIELANAGTGKVLVGQTQFGIVEFMTKTDFTRVTRFLRAVAFSPALPVSLAPGASWKGTIGGAGTPNQQRYVRFVFGPFNLPQGTPSAKPFTWITDHAQHVFVIVI